MFGLVTEGQQLYVDKLQPPLKPCPVRWKRVNVFVKHKTEQQQNARSCSGKSKSRMCVSLSLSLSPASQPLSGIVPSHLSPMVFCSLSAVTSVPLASFPIHSVAIGMFETPAW